MNQYIFGSRNKIHIINLERPAAVPEAQTTSVVWPPTARAPLFVGTKRQARKSCAKKLPALACRC